MEAEVVCKPTRSELQVLRLAKAAGKRLRYFNNVGGVIVKLEDVEGYENTLFYVTYKQMENINWAFTKPLKNNRGIPFEDRPFHEIPCIEVTQRSATSYKSVTVKRLPEYKEWI